MVRIATLSNLKGGHRRRSKQSEDSSSEQSDAYEGPAAVSGTARRASGRIADNRSKADTLRAALGNASNTEATAKIAASEGRGQQNALIAVKEDVAIPAKPFAGTGPSRTLQGLHRTARIITPQQNITTQQKTDTSVNTAANNVENPSPVRHADRMAMLAAVEARIALEQKRHAVSNKLKKRSMAHAMGNLTNANDYIN